ncbi:hypothetical protein ABI59_05075 [Acidobacteria bacterium Mor1]|nr:hypothetical protein ABI59_05075 [Acidobacteria bacterium Mor1]
MASRQEQAESTTRRALEVCEEGASHIRGALAYVPHVARRYMSCGLPFDELLAAGNLGLVEAALRFNPDKQVKFVTYADWWIRKSILKAVEEQTGAVRLPRYRQEQLRVLTEGRRSWRRHHGSEPDRDQLSEATGFTPDEIDRLSRIGNGSLSLEEPVAPGAERGVGDLLAVEPSEGPHDLLLRGDLLRFLRKQLFRLEQKQRTVILLRYGFGDEGPMTLRQIGRRMGISRERVRQLERRALIELRNFL